MSPEVTSRVGDTIPPVFKDEFLARLNIGTYFGTSARFWIGLQDDYDIQDEEIQIEDELNRVPTIAS